MLPELDHDMIYENKFSLFITGQHGQRQSEQNWNDWDQNYHSMKAYKIWIPTFRPHFLIKKIY